MNGTVSLDEKPPEEGDLVEGIFLLLGLFIFLPAAFLGNLYGIATTGFVAGVNNAVQTWRK